MESTDTQSTTPSQIHRAQPPLRHIEHNPLSEKRIGNDNENSSPMALSDAAREWFTKNDLEGFLRIADAPPHEEPEQVAPTIDLADITEGTIQALTGLQAGRVQLVESPSTEILMEYFGEYSLSSKVGIDNGSV